VHHEHLRLAVDVAGMPIVGTPIASVVAPAPFAVSV
jgi:hypothetical protein